MSYFLLPQKQNENKHTIQCHRPITVNANALLFQRCLLMMFAIMFARASNSNHFYVHQWNQSHSHNVATIRQNSVCWMKTEQGNKLWWWWLQMCVIVVSFLFLAFGLQYRFDCLFQCRSSTMGKVCHMPALNEFHLIVIHNTKGAICWFSFSSFWIAMSRKTASDLHFSLKRIQRYRYHHSWSIYVQHFLWMVFISFFYVFRFFLYAVHCAFIRIHIDCAKLHDVDISFFIEFITIQC